MKWLKTSLIAAALAIMCAMSSFAGNWEQTANGYYYRNGETYLTNTWLQDGGKWYFLGADGLMAVNTAVDEYQLGADGAEISGAASIISQFPQMIVEAAAEAGKTTAQTGSANVSNSTADTTISYVLNTNSKKFHKPGCKSVSAMSAKNRKDSGSSREEIIAAGYQPCKNCNP